MYLDVVKTTFEKAIWRVRVNLRPMYMWSNFVSEPRRSGPYEDVGRGVQAPQAVQHPPVRVANARPEHLRKHGERVSDHDTRAYTKTYITKTYVNTLVQLKLNSRNEKCGVCIFVLNKNCATPARTPG